MRLHVHRVVVIFFLLFVSTAASAETRVYFSPTGGCEEHIVEMIGQTHHQLDIAMYSLNNQQILSALEDAKDRGVNIRILLDRSQAFGNSDETLWLKKHHFDVRLHSHNKIQHNKFAIADGRLIETGSFNWTIPAEESNDENCVFMDEATIAHSYQAQFDDNLWPDNSEKKSKQHFIKLRRKKEATDS